MNELTANLDRAKWAAAALQAFADEVASGDTADVATLLGDLLCDLGHFADSKGLDYQAIVAKSLGTWKAEVADPLGVSDPPYVQIRIEAGQHDQAGAA